MIKLRPRIAGQAKTALMAALSSPYMHPKLAIAVDEDIDASDLRQVFWSLTTRVHAERDVTQVHNTRIWSLDNVSDIVPGMSPMYRIAQSSRLTRPCRPEPTRRTGRVLPVPCRRILRRSISRSFCRRFWHDGDGKARDEQERGR